MPREHKVGGKEKRRIKYIFELTMMLNLKLLNDLYFIELAF